MRNYDIIKEIFKITQKEIEGDRWERQYAMEEKVKEIERLISNERPAITGPKWRQKEAGIDY